MSFVPKIKLKARSIGASTLGYSSLMLLQQQLQEEPKMDLGVKLCYLIWCSQDRWDINRHIHVDVVKNIYDELAKTSPLFSYWEKKGVVADDVVRMLTHGN